MGRQLFLQGPPKLQGKANSFFSVILVLVTLLPGLPQPVVQLNLQPLLLNLPREQPDTSASVIVKKSTRHNSLDTDSWLQGQGVGIGVVDSGVNSSLYDFTDPRGNSRVVGQTKSNRSAPGSEDLNGHGTLVAGVLGSNGKGSNGDYPGVAPQ